MHTSTTATTWLLITLLTSTMLCPLIAQAAQTTAEQQPTTATFNKHAALMTANVFWLGQFAACHVGHELGNLIAEHIGRIYLDKSATTQVTLYKAFLQLLIYLPKSVEWLNVVDAIQAGIETPTTTDTHTVVKANVNTSIRRSIYTAVCSCIRTILSHSVYLY